MYNKTRKNMYLDSVIDSDKTNIRSVLERVGEFEEKYGVDFYDMDVVQTRETYLSLCGRARSSMAKRLSDLRAYCTWCTAQAELAPRVHPVFLLDFRSLSNEAAIKNTMVGDRRDLVRKINEMRCERPYIRVAGIKVPDQAEGYTNIQTVAKLALLLAFDGFLNEMFQIRLSEGQSWVLNDKPIRLSRETRQLALFLEAQKGIYSYRQGKKIFLDFTASDYLLKTTGAVELREQTIVQTLRRSKLEFRFSLKDIFDSGVFCRLYELERKSGEKAGRKELASLYGVWDFKRSHPDYGKINKKYQLYQDWKSTFCENPEAI